MSSVAIYDATGANFAHLPAGQAAGYTTGSAGVPWDVAMWAARPGAVRIDQTPAASPWDALADVQDFEAGAVTLAELPARVKAMQAAWHAADRPGQRAPAVYVGARPNATPVVNALLAAGLTSGAGLAIAAPGMPDSEAQALIEAEHGTPWPIIWVQNGFHGGYDSGWADVAWLEAVSRAPRRLTGVTLTFSAGPAETYGPAQMA